MILALWLACTADPVEAFERARAEQVVAPIRSQAAVRLRLADRDVGGRGALVVERPGRARLAVRDPLGAPVAQAVMDGTRAALLVPAERTVFVAEHAEGVARLVSRGMWSLDDAVALLVGDVPMSRAPVLHAAWDEDDVLAWVGGPTGQMAARVAPHGVVRLELPGIIATWERDPEAVRSLRLRVPAAELALDLDYDGWEVLETAPAGAFDVVQPEGWRTAPVEELVPHLGRPDR